MSARKTIADELDDARRDAAFLRADNRVLRSRLAALEGLILDFFSEIPNREMGYPIKDYYGSGDEEEDAKAPLWSEAGLYGRVGKEAARTLLARKARIDRELGGEEGK